MVWLSGSQNTQAFNVDYLVTILYSKDSLNINYRIQYLGIKSLSRPPLIDRYMLLHCFLLLLLCRMLTMYMFVKTLSCMYELVQYQARQKKNFIGPTAYNWVGQSSSFLGINKHSKQLISYTHSLIFHKIIGMRSFKNYCSGHGRTNCTGLASLEYIHF